MSRREILTEAERQQLLGVPFDAVPLGWSHISLTGDYLWDQAATGDGFRPLNIARNRLRLVA